ncbi:hypothetical protein GW17_00058610 [Ensete ventricosum]|nr:hypothetical protein GW17_00058610 [Ensete ventricosum]RZS26910.1 hypothetical protein BHM03_00060330 [Ensete ventricosum]
MWWDLAGSSLGDLPKELGSSLGKRRKIAEKKTEGLTTRLPEVTRLCEMSDGWTARTTESGWQPAAFGE